jgi:hypothetical protein
VQNIYVLRSLYPSFFRLGLSATLLLGSAGLAVAASLLLYTTTQPAAWSSATPAASSLTTNYFGGNTAPLTGLAASTQSTDTYATTITNISPITQNAGIQLATSELAPAAGASPLAAVQRAWLTIKQAFR